ncbi:cobalamin-dependent protein [Rhodomicrobium lacus]|uniref:cobalamin-dependent protein n=1 Tax=Rhodomicrobium lacus TaxID=2498452 RepID=UPI000F8CB4CB
MPIKPAAADAGDFTPSDIERFTSLLLSPDGSGASAFLDRRRDEGYEPETILLGLFGPAAVRLGHLWESDHCGFTQVTIAVSRLRELLRTRAVSYEFNAQIWHHGRRALLASTPGDQHTLGLFVVESFFRRDGWDVWGGQIDSSEEITHLVGRQWFAVAGFSLSSERFLDRLASLIRSVRRHSCNRDIGVLVGGAVFLQQPDLVERVGADAFATDGRLAVLRARTLLAQKPLRN